MGLGVGGSLVGVGELWMICVCVCLCVRGCVCVRVCACVYVCMCTLHSSCCPILDLYNIEHVLW